MTCKYVASAIANVPGGMLVDTVGRKGLLMAVSLFWIGFPYLLIGFTHSYLMLLVCVALVGFGNSLWHPTAIPTLGAALSRAQGPGAVGPRHGRQRRRRGRAARHRRGAGLLHLARGGGAERGAGARGGAAAASCSSARCAWARKRTGGRSASRSPTYLRGLQRLAAQPRRWCCSRPAPRSAP